MELVWVLLREMCLWLCLINLFFSSVSTFVNEKNIARESILFAIASGVLSIAISLKLS